MSARREIPEEMRQLGWSLRRLRLDAGLTGQQLAEQTGAEPVNRLPYRAGPGHARNHGHQQVG
jgi:hypothetical protein